MEVNDSIIDWCVIPYSELFIGFLCSKYSVFEGAVNPVLILKECLLGGNECQKKNSPNAEHIPVFACNERPASGQLSRYSDSPRTGRSGDRIPVGARFSAPVRTNPGGLPSLLYNGYRVIPGGEAAGA